MTDDLLEPPVEPLTIADRLVQSSTRFARTAMDAYVAERWDVFYLHLSTGVEQLLKGVLASVHPTLIAEKAGDFETLLHLTGNKQLAKTPESAVRTVTVVEAIRRVGQVLSDFRQPTPRVTFLLDTRNGIVHAGHDVRAEHQAVLGEVATFLRQFIERQGLDNNDYWGPHADLVNEHVHRRMDALEAAYERRVRAARETHEQSIARLTGDELSTFLDGRQPQGPAENYDAARAVCPACGRTGLLTGHPDAEWQADWDTEGGEAYVSGAYVSAIRLIATGFHCAVCSLTLDAKFLPFAGFSAVDLTEDDADLDYATEYFTRQLADEGWDDVY